MIGRAALGNPWIFRGILNYLQFEEKELSEKTTVNEFEIPDINEKISVMLEQLDAMITQMGEITAVKEMRKHFAWYLKGVYNANHVKAKLMQCKTRQEAVSLLESIV